MLWVFIIIFIVNILCESDIDVYVSMIMENKNKIKNVTLNAKGDLLFVHYYIHVYIIILFKINILC